MATLEALPNVTKLNSRVIRVLGQNPGKFTLQGTNIYLLGTSNPYILVDTGEGKDDFLPVFESVLTSEASPSDPSLPDVSDIIISHWHGDHIGGLPGVLATLHKLWIARNRSMPYPAPRIHKHPLSTEPDSEYYMLPKILSALPKDGFTPTPSGAITHDLYDSQIITAKDTTLRILHTPGHTLDSISIHIPEERTLYTADTVLGAGTAVFEDLSLYITSLNKMLDLKDRLEYDTLIPSHGPVVVNGAATISMYIKHRLEREAQVLTLLMTKSPPPGDEHWTTWTIVKDLYAAYPENLWEPASRGILLHMKKLEGEGKVKKLGGELKHTQWKVVSRTPSPSL